MGHTHTAWWGGDYSTKVKLRVDWILHHQSTTTHFLICQAGDTFRMY